MPFAVIQMADKNVPQSWITGNKSWWPSKGVDAGRKIRTQCAPTKTWRQHEMQILANHFGDYLISCTILILYEWRNKSSLHFKYILENYEMAHAEMIRKTNYSNTASENEALDAELENRKHPITRRIPGYFDALPNLNGDLDAASSNASAAHSSQTSQPPSQVSTHPSQRSDTIAETPSQRLNNVLETPPSQSNSHPSQQFEPMAQTSHY